MSNIPTSTRKKVRRRDGDQCGRCGCPGTEIQHRMRRREGGHSPSNLALMCNTCHRWAHANPEEARQAGWVVPTYADPADVPMLTFSGWVLLSDDYTMTYLDLGAMPGAVRT